MGTFYERPGCREEHTHPALLVSPRRLRRELDYLFPSDFARSIALLSLLVGHSRPQTNATNRLTTRLTCGTLAYERDTS